MESYNKFSNQFLKNVDSIPSKQVVVSDDDDFLQLEKEVNEEGDDADDRVDCLSSNVDSFITGDEKRKHINDEKVPNHRRIVFSSDSDFEAPVEKEHYLRKYLKAILTDNLYEAIQRGSYFKPLEEPDKARPFQISIEYSNLMIDVMNEVIETDNLGNFTYDQYIERLFVLFCENPNKKFKEESPKEIPAQYKYSLDQSQFNLLFKLSDRILKKQKELIFPLIIQENIVSDLETIIIGSSYDEDQPRRGKGRINESAQKKQNPPQQSPKESTGSIESISDTFAHDVDFEVEYNNEYEDEYENPSDEIFSVELIESGGGEYSNDDF